MSWFLECLYNLVCFFKKQLWGGEPTGDRQQGGTYYSLAYNLNWVLHVLCLQMSHDEILIFISVFSISGLKRHVGITFRNALSINWGILNSTCLFWNFTSWFSYARDAYVSRDSQDQNYLLAWYSNRLKSKRGKNAPMIWTTWEFALARDALAASCEQRTECGPVPPGEEEEANWDRGQARRSAQAHGGSVQGQESQEGFHDPWEKEETQGEFWLLLKESGSTEQVSVYSCCCVRRPLKNWRRNRSARPPSVDASSKSAAEPLRTSKTPTTVWLLHILLLLFCLLSATNLLIFQKWISS